MAPLFSNREFKSSSSSLWPTMPKEARLAITLSSPEIHDQTGLSQDIRKSQKSLQGFPRLLGLVANRQSPSKSLMFMSSPIYEVVKDKTCLSGFFLVTTNTPISLEGGFIHASPHTNHRLHILHDGQNVLRLQPVKRMALRSLNDFILWKKGLVRLQVRIPLKFKLIPNTECKVKACAILFWTMAFYCITLCVVKRFLAKKTWMSPFLVNKF